MALCPVAAALGAGAAVTLGEGDTPLVALPRWGAAHGLRGVYAKLEFANPTGSFKDRGMAVLVSLARAEGARTWLGFFGKCRSVGGGLPPPGGDDLHRLCPGGRPGGRACARSGPTALSWYRWPAHGGTSPALARAAWERTGQLPRLSQRQPALRRGEQDLRLRGSGGAAGARWTAAPWHVVIPTGGGALFCRRVPGLSGVGRPPARWPRAALPRLHPAQTTACPPIVAAWEQGAAAPVAIRGVRPSVGGSRSRIRPRPGHPGGDPRQQWPGGG